MALFVDGPSPTIDGLIDQDSGLLDVAETCGINLTTKLRLGHEEIATDLELWLQRPGRPLEMVWGPLYRVEQIVVTAPLKQWETMHALALSYRDAYFSQLADRYQAKWDEYARLARAAYENFLPSGMGLVHDPVRRALPPLLSTVVGPQTGGTFYASVAWVNAAGQEGAASPASSISVPDGHLMTVSAVSMAANAVGFNVYAGPALSDLVRQNDVLLPTSAAFTYVPGEVTQGALPGTGQKPDFKRPLARTLLRG
jgi:hypothetical protein